MGQSPVTIIPVEKRDKNFHEVSLGYPKKIALEEARRCPQSAVYQPVCPLDIDILRFIRHLRENEPVKALEVIREKNCLPAVCGRICPAPCETSVGESAPIGIRGLERYASDHGRKRLGAVIKRAGKKIAIVGSGPAALSAAAELAAMDYQVTIFESLSEAGGALRYGIPEFRLPAKVLDEEIEFIKSLGVDIRTNVFVGWTTTFKELFLQGFKAILLAVGAGTPRTLDVSGTNLGGVFYAEEFLMRVNLMKANQFPRYATPLNIGRKIVVIGSGNTALDCARICVRLKRDVTLTFLRTEEDIHGLPNEKEYAKQEGVKLAILTKPLEILGTENHFVRGVRAMHMDFADTGDGKWELKAVPDSEFVLEADTVIIAVGHNPNTLLKKVSPDLQFNDDGTIRTDANGMTSLKGIFACGNVTMGAGAVVEAMASGKRIAGQIQAFLKTQ